MREGTMVGIAFDTYEHFPRLPNAVQQVRELGELAGEFEYRVDIGENLALDRVRSRLKEWRTEWRRDGANGPVLVAWSGHGTVREPGGLRLVAADTESGQALGETYAPGELAEEVLRSGAHQALLLIDTCHAGAGSTEVVQEAIRDHDLRTLAQGQDLWLGVLASCRAREQADGRGVLLEAVLEVLRDGPAPGPYRRAWSVRNEGVTGQALAEAVQAGWTEEGQRPAYTATGVPRVMFRNPRWQPAARPALVEHLVLAAKGADPTEESWLFHGRQRVLGELVTWMGGDRPGLRLVTGSAGCGKSAVLGRLATLSDPQQRTEVLKHLPLAPGDPDPGAGSVAVTVHLRGLTALQAAAAVAEQRGLGDPRTVSELVAWLELDVRGDERPPVLLFDGLDEVGPGEISPMVELLEPLARIGLVLVSLRSSAFQRGEQWKDALERLRLARPEEIDLDQEQDTAEDIAGHLELRLRADGMTGNQAVAAARLLGDRAVASGGGFLFARLVGPVVAQRLSGQEPAGWVEELPTTVAAAFDAAVDALEVRRRGDGTAVPQAGRVLLTALAWAFGRGLPADGVWEAVAGALDPTGETYGTKDVDWALEALGRFIVEDTSGGVAVYRLYHQEFIDHLAGSFNERAVQARWAGPARAATESLGELAAARLTGEGSHRAGDFYLRRYLAEHAGLGDGAGIPGLRALNERDSETFRSTLAQALNRLGATRATRGERLTAGAPALEAVEHYRGLTAEDPEAFLPDLADALHNLAATQAALGDRDNALATITEAVTIRRHLAATNPQAFLPDLAMSLNNLAAAQGELGDRHNALATITEAVKHYRDLATTNPQAFLPNLAMSLNNLTGAQAALGDRHNALATITEAVTIRRDLATTNPQAFLPDLAMSLNNLAAAQGELGDRHNALATITEAVKHYRNLTTTNPQAFLPNLASALTNLAAAQSDLGDRHNALATITEAVKHYRNLTTTNPQAFLPDLASALNNLANRQAALGDRHNALATVTEAVTIQRDLAATNPQAFLPNLAGFLNNLANRQAALGDRHNALATITEAVKHYRNLTTTNPQAFLPNLAMSLNNLANYRAALGNHHDALATVTEAVTIRRNLAATNPQAFLPNLAGSLNNLANRQAAVGNHHDALATITEAVKHYRNLTTTNPQAFLPDLASALNSLASAQSDLGDRHNALATITEAVTIRRNLATTNPQAFLPNLAMSLNNLANRQASLGNHHDALATITEAVKHYRNLTTTNPQAFLPDLASSLNNLSSAQAALGDRHNALATITEAVTIRRDLTTTNPQAFLPDLASALNNLSSQHIAAGTPTAALPHFDRCISQLAGHPLAVARLTLALASHNIRSDNQRSGVRQALDLLSDTAEVQLTPELRHRCHTLLRDLAAESGELLSLVAEEWAATAPSALPPWLTVSPGDLELVRSWVNLPSWSARRDFYSEHTTALRGLDLPTAVEESGPLPPEFVQFLVALLHRAAAEGPEAAFRRQILQELAVDWLNTPDWPASQDFLERHRTELLAPGAAELLDLEDEEEDLDVRLHLAILHLAAETDVPTAYRALADRATLHARLRQALAAPDPTALRHCAAIELAVYRDEFAAAGHRLMADALTDAPLPAADPGLATTDPGARNAALAEVAELIRRHPVHAAGLGKLLHLLLPPATE
ncbi:hypothetical protein [Kitasatospora sp. NPDC002040]|uniref:hypothetical protein n=1 Tax=Kitasatospora sp. NPDC002040 TaxID=3154661 RepID=UPI003326CB3F